MGEHHSRHHSYEGMRLNKNLYNLVGTLIIPALTVLTVKDIDMLLQQNIILRAEDVEDVTIFHLVDSAILEVKNIFDIACYSDKIPFDAIRDKIVPVVMFMSKHPDFAHILNHL